MIRKINIDKVIEDHNSPERKRARLRAQRRENKIEDYAF
jgi:hypothetical protein